MIQYPGFKRKIIFSFCILKILVDILSMQISYSQDFTMILIPDTQYESQSYPAIFNSKTQFVVDSMNAKNIVFVTHQGDIVHIANNQQQWQNADAAMDLLDAANVKYSVGPGNHDLPIYTSPSYYNTYFGIDRFSDKSWYGGYFGSDNYNNYSLFSASGMDFILINLQYDPSTAILDWADALLASNSDRRAIIVSHSILNINNSFTPIGTNIFNALKDNANLFLMLCGHTHSNTDGAAYRSEIGDQGQDIHIMMADYQEYPNGGNGYLRILRFSPDDDMIYVSTYSPYIDDYITSYPDQMTIEYEMVDPPPVGMLGDVNGDEIVNSTDALIVLSCDVGIDVAGFCPLNCADVNADGFINSTDALIILSYDAGMSVPFLIGESGCPVDVTPCIGCNP